MIINTGWRNTYPEEPLKLFGKASSENYRNFRWHLFSEETNVFDFSSDVLCSSILCNFKNNASPNSELITPED